MAYYLAVGMDRRGPFEIAELLSNGMRPDSLVWREGLTEWLRADALPELRQALNLPPTTSAAPPAPTMAQPLGYQGYPAPSYANASSKKILAGLMGILFGGWGIHRFVMGDVLGGFLRIVITVVTCGLGGLIGLIEGIIYLTKSDADFYQIYMVQRRGWF